MKLGKKPWTWHFGPALVTLDVRTPPCRGVVTVPLGGADVVVHRCLYHTAGPGDWTAVDLARDAVTHLRAAADAIEAEIHPERSDR